MKKPLIACGATTLPAGCAQSPESAQPSYALDVPFPSRTGDTPGVIFVGLPVSSMSGSNVGPEIARLKGAINAVQTASNLMNCTHG